MLYLYTCARNLLCLTLQQNRHLPCRLPFMSHLPDFSNREEVSQSLSNKLILCHDHNLSTIKSLLIIVHLPDHYMKCVSYFFSRTRPPQTHNPLYFRLAGSVSSWMKHIASRIARAKLPCLYVV